MKIEAIALLAAFVCVGCNNKQEAAPTPAAKPEKAAEAPKEAPKPATTPAALAQVEEDEDLPTTADFEDDAEKEINKDSVDSEVDKLAKEIGE